MIAKICEAECRISARVVTHGENGMLITNPCNENNIF